MAANGRVESPQPRSLPDIQRSDAARLRAQSGLEQRAPEAAESGYGPAAAAAPRERLSHGDGDPRKAGERGARSDAETLRCGASLLTGEELAVPENDF